MNVAVHESLTESAATDVWRSPFDRQKGLRRVRTRLHRAIARVLWHFGLRVQARMDIDPRSTWHDPDFVDRADAGDFSGRKAREDDWADKDDLVRRDMLLCLAAWLNRAQVRGAVAEIGVANGMTASLLGSAFPGRDVFLFDTFTGYVDSDIAEELAVTGMSVGGFPGKASPAVALARLPSAHGVHVYEGSFPGSVDDRVRGQPFAFVHIDVDLYRPVRAALEVFYPLMQPGGLIVVHDYNAWPGARRAVNEFLDRTPLPAIPMPDKSGSVVICRV